VPWQECSAMSVRLAFIQACLDRREKIVTICDRFEISEKTGHKWLGRFRAGGEAALADQSHAPRTHPHHVEAAVVDRLLALRKKHPLYGPVKLRDWLEQHEPETTWPAASTIGELLKREGLVHRRRQRHAGHAPLVNGRTVASAPNVVWTADFKGQFRVGAGMYCYPLTVLDLHTHFLLGCTSLPSTAVRTARAQFLRLFGEYGLPDVLRTDNGVPFAQPNALGRLGSLAFWWVRLGIKPEHTRPATPSENGAHERFHKTLKAHTTRPSAPTLRAQQQRFDRFQVEYNTERPHEATVGHQPPAVAYTPSARPYPARLPALHYPDAEDVRRVSSTGAIKWRNHAIFLSHNLARLDVAVRELDEETFRIRFAQLILGHFDLRRARFTPDVRWETE
jgi:putative transposase